MPTAFAIWEIEVASNPCTENKSSDASRISCFVFPRSINILLYYNRNVSLVWLYYNYLSFGSQ